MQQKDIETLAKEMRTVVRRKAGLNCDWNLASDDMKDWYRKLAKRALENHG